MSDGLELLDLTLFEPSISLYRRLEHCLQEGLPALDYADMIPLPWTFRTEDSTASLC